MLVRLGHNEYISAHSSDGSASAQSVVNVEGAGRYAMTRPELTKCPDLTHKQTNRERRRFGGVGKQVFSVMGPIWCVENVICHQKHGRETMSE